MRGLVIGVVIGVVFARPSFAQRPELRLDVGSAPHAAHSTSPRIGATGSSVYVVWSDLRNGRIVPWGKGSYVTGFDIYFTRSLDDGATWLASNERLDTGDRPGNGNSFEPEIAVSGSSVYVAWVDFRRGGDIHFNRSLDEGLTWLPSDVRLALDRPRAAKIAASGSCVSVVWLDAEHDLFSNVSLDSGTTWSESKPITSSGGYPVLAASGPCLYVAWRREWHGNSFIRFNRSLDGGATWLPSDVQLGLAGGGRASAAQIAASGSSVQVTWQDREPFTGLHDIYLNCSQDGGMTWLPADVRLDLRPLLPNGDSTKPQIATSGPFVYVAWAERPGGNPYRNKVALNRSQDGGTTWLSQAVPISAEVTHGVHPQIATTGLECYVTWTGFEYLSGLFIDRSLDGGASWLEIEPRLNPTTLCLVSSHCMAVSGSSVYVAWDDNAFCVDGCGLYGPDIYFNLAHGFQPYGKGTPGAGGVIPRIAGSGEASIGGTMSIDLAGGRGGTVGTLFMGLHGPASIPFGPGTLLVQAPFRRVPVVLGGRAGAAGAGSTRVPLSIPNDLSLLGRRINFQASFLDPDAPRTTGIGGPHAASALSLTGGLETWLL